MSPEVLWFLLYRSAQLTPTVKISRDGSLHLATANGNFDMYGNAGDVQQAVAAITPLAAGRK